MSARDDILTLARIYAEREDLTTPQASWRIFHDSNKLGSLKNGGDIFTTRAEATLQWLSDNWPDGLDWPDGIDRPEPSETQAA